MRRLAVLMTPIIHFGCPDCSSEIPAPSGGPGTVACPHSGKTAELGISARVRDGECVDVCAVCGHPDLYVQKDFNRTLGLSIVVLGSLASFVFFAIGEPVLAVLALVAMALVDGVIYLLVGQVTVCYACHAIYRGFGPNPEHKPFNLELLERYGGRAPRR
jgi:hypothetical protein